MRQRSVINIKSTPCISLDEPSPGFGFAGRLKIRKIENCHTEGREV